MIIVQVHLGPKSRAKAASMGVVSDRRFLVAFRKASPKALLPCLLFVSLAAPQALALPSCGDGNGSGSVNASDALLTLRKAVGIAADCATCACDVNADGRVNSADALAVLRRAVGAQPYLACITSPACQSPLPALANVGSSSVAPAALARPEISGLVKTGQSWLRFFGGSLSLEVPAVSSDSDAISAAAPPLAAGVLPPADGFRVQAIQRNGAAIAASNAVVGLTIPALPTGSHSIGSVTQDFLDGVIQRCTELAAQLPGHAIAANLTRTESALTTLRTAVAELRAGSKQKVELGRFGGKLVTLRRADLAESDAMLLASLKAQAQVGSTARASAINCRQSDANAYYNDLLNNRPTTQSAPTYFTSTCAAEGFNIGYAVVLGSAALGTGVLVLGGAPAIALALPAAAVLYVSVAASGGLMAVGSSLAANSQDGVALIKEGVNRAESTMRQLVTGTLLPGASGTILDMAEAVKDLGQAFDLFTPPLNVTTTSNTTLSTVSPGSSSSTLPQGNGCYCCCAFWEGVSGNYTCRESLTPQQPAGDVSNCFEYSQHFCDIDFCES